MIRDGRSLQLNFALDDVGGRRLRPELVQVSVVTGLGNRLDPDLGLARENLGQQIFKILLDLFCHRSLAVIKQSPDQFADVVDFGVDPRDELVQGRGESDVLKRTALLCRVLLLLVLATIFARL